MKNWWTHRSVIICWFSVRHLNDFCHQARAVRAHQWQKSDWLPVALTSGPSITVTNHHRWGGVIHQTLPASVDTSGPMAVFPWFNEFCSPVAVRTTGDEHLTDAHPERELLSESSARLERNELLENILLFLKQRFITAMRHIQCVKMSLGRSWGSTGMMTDS